MNLAIKNEKKLIKKYPSANVEGDIDKLLKYFTKNPFEEKIKEMWLPNIKEFLIFENLDYEENPNVIFTDVTKKDEVKPKGKKLSKEESSILLEKIHKNIIKSLKKYIDIKEEYFNIIALWIIGTYFHQEFPSFPFLFFNAQRGSGKSRVLNLITTLAKDGSLQNSMTEATLFRTKGTLAIDEYEGVTRKGGEALRELLNSAYKKGIKIRRMRQQKTQEGTEQVVEEFEVYRPIILANIFGMESVLGDRCITLILEKSSDQRIINLMEIFEHDELIIKTKKLLNQCSLCSFLLSVEGYKEWNNFITHNYTNNTYNTYNTNSTNYIEAFKSINLMDLNGRELELSFPLCLIASEIGVKTEKETTLTLKETTLTLKELFRDKRAEELVEDNDVSLIDFVSQEVENNYYVVGKLTERFKQFLNSTDEYLNARWMGRALKRLNLIKEKRRMGRGTEVQLDILKAQKKIKMYR